MVQKNIPIFANATTNLKATQMKQVLLMAVLAAGMLLVGCSKEEGNSMQFTINESSISLLAHDDYKITPSGAFTARSSNEDVATVSSDGIIHGVSAGDADIIFTSVENPNLAQTCKVNVDWRYKYFEDPVIAFGATKEEIKAMETHEVTYIDDCHTGYTNTKMEIEMLVAYHFDNDGKLNVIRVSVDSQIRHQDFPDKIIKQLTERYGEPIITEKSNDETVFEPRSKDFSAHFYPHKLLIEYLPRL